MTYSQRDLSMILALILLTITSTFLVATVSATSEPALQCMGGRITDVTFLIGEATITLVDSELDSFYAWIGEDIWLGYPADGEEFVQGEHGFDVPEDVYRYFKLQGTGDQNQDVEVWVYASPTTPETMYVFPFKSTEIFARDDGSYYGIHPCGAYAIPAADVTPIVDSIWNSVDRNHTVTETTIFIEKLCLCFIIQARGSR